MSSFLDRLSDRSFQPDVLNLKPRIPGRFEKAEHQTESIDDAALGSFEPPIENSAAEVHQNKIGPSSLQQIPAPLKDKALTPVVEFENDVSVASTASPSLDLAGANLLSPPVSPLIELHGQGRSQRSPNSDAGLLTTDTKKNNNPSPTIDVEPVENSRPDAHAIVIENVAAAPKIAPISELPKPKLNPVPSIAVESSERNKQVTVSIGTIEVNVEAKGKQRNSPPPILRQSTAQPSSKVLSLSEYVSQREGGRR